MIPRRTSTDGLALFGGPPAVSADLDFSPPYPTSSVRDIFAVVRCLRSGALTAGERNEREIPGLQREYAKYVGVRNCLAVSSGTAALHAAVAAVGIEPGDEVIVPALSFLASATAVMHHQGIPVFVDIDPVTFNINPSLIAERVTHRTRAVEIVDLHGLPADADTVSTVAHKHGLLVIEDFAQAHGASYGGRKAGALGDIGAASIMADKNLPTCGEGGLLTTDSADLVTAALRVGAIGDYASGADRHADDFLGWNYRLSPIQAAYARTQLRRLDELNAIRQRNATSLDRSLRELVAIEPPFVPEGSTHAYYLYRFTVHPSRLGLDVPVGRFRKALQEALLAEGVPAREWQNTPLAGIDVFRLQQAYGRGCPWTCKRTDEFHYRVEDYPNALQVIESSLVLSREVLLSSPSDLETYVNAFRKVFEHLDTIAQHALDIEYESPWLAAARLA